jgi:hypothetical protein
MMKLPYAKESSALKTRIASKPAGSTKDECRMKHVV